MTALHHSPRRCGAQRASFPAAFPRTVLLLASLCVPFGAGCRRQESVAPEPILVKVLTVPPAAVAENSLRYSGTVKANSSVNLSFKVGGYVQQIARVPQSDGTFRLVQSGDRVARGSLLAQVRRGEYQSQVESAQASLEGRRAAVEQAQAGVGQAQAGVRAAQATVAEAGAGRAAAVAQLEQTRAALQQAQAGVAEARAARTAAASQLEQARAGEEGAPTQVSEARASLAAATAQLGQAQAGLEQAKAAQREAEAGTGAAAAALEQAEAARDQARLDWERADRLYARQSLTKPEWDGARARADSTAAQVKAAANQVTAAREREQRARAQVREVAAKVEATQAQIQAAQAQIARAEAGVKNSAGAVAAARAQVAAADSRVARAQSAVQQAQATVKAAQTQVEAATAKQKQAQAQVASSTQAVTGARAAVAGAAAAQTGARAQLDQAQYPLSDATLRAPMDAVVLERRVEMGDLAGPGSVGFVLGDTRSVKVVFGVPDRELGRLRLGQTLGVTVSALPGRTLGGRISSLGEAADPQTRLFNVELTIPNPDNALKVGMVASLELRQKSAATPGIAIPLSAVVRSGTGNGSGNGGYAVLVAQGEGEDVTLKKRPVQLGSVTGNGITVKSGLRPGERIVVTGAEAATDGQQARIIP